MKKYYKAVIRSEKAKNKFISKDGIFYTLDNEDEWYILRNGPMKFAPPRKIKGSSVLEWERTHEFVPMSEADIMLELL